MDDLCAHFQHVNSAIERAVNRSLKGTLGISRAQGIVLSRLIDTNLCVSQLASVVDGDVGGVSRLVAKLCDSGLVQRQYDQQDRRTCTLELTLDGRSVAKDVRNTMIRSSDAAFNVLSKDELQHFRSLLTRLVNNAKA
ncbi:MarR family winged helix-turn-helix transcriptional regulator [Paraburkholderia phytofirmans]|uniref:MarR family winged helix-turn-helix transcriptional regulator n=1 Tax=Paraburkholderia phytofirmans TaxID=261302 RepID=UPI0038BC35CD